MFRGQIERAPADPVLRFGLGNELYRIEQWREAAAEFRRAVELKPDWSAAWRQLGRALLKAGDPAAAGTAFQSGLAAAEAQGDLQTKREIESYMKRMA